MAKLKTTSLNIVGIKELKDKASAIIESVHRTGKRVIITKNNREVAQIVSITEKVGEKTLSEHLLELGIISTPARHSFEEIEFKGKGMDASIAIAAILEDRNED